MNQICEELWTKTTLYRSFIQRFHTVQFIFTGVIAWHICKYAFRIRFGRLSYRNSATTLCKSTTCVAKSNPMKTIGIIITWLTPNKTTAANTKTAWKGKPTTKMLHFTLAQLDTRSLQKHNDITLSSPVVQYFFQDKIMLPKSTLCCLRLLRLLFYSILEVSAQFF